MKSKFNLGLFMCILMVMFACGVPPGAQATASPVPLHCLDYTDVEDSNFPDTVFVLANCTETDPGGGIVELRPIASFFDGDIGDLASVHYVTGLDGKTMRVSPVMGNETPVVGYEATSVEDRRISKAQLIGVEQELHSILDGAAIAQLPPDPLKGESSGTTTEAAAIDLEKLTANIIQAVQWYETVRPLLTQLALNSASEADNAIINVLDLTLKPLSLTLKEVNGIVNSVKSGATSAEKAQYTTDAALRIQASTAGLQTWIWTLVYEKIDAKQ